MSKRYYVPSTKTELVNSIKDLSAYSTKDIQKIYTDVTTKYPWRLSYYAKQAWRKRLLAVYFSLLEKKSKWLI